MRFATAAHFATLALCLSVATNLVAEPPNSAPNVVMLISDDQAWTDYGFMGHEIIETPKLDAFARQSVVYSRGYVPSSLCRPSLMTMITGRYPHEHGITGNDPPKGVNRNDMLTHVDAAQTLPKLLGEAGYKSLQTGKWWEGSPARGGFTHAMTHGDTSRGGRHGDVGLKIGREGLEPIFSFLKERGDSPFFLWYAPFLPHTPHNPPQRLFEKYKAKVDSPHVARYYAMCEWFDETCGELLDHLEAEGLAENTIVVYVCDNGWIQNPNAGNYAAKSKRSPYDGGIRTPIMVRWPARLTPRFDRETLVSSIDLAPTILAACGVKAPAGLPGENLLQDSAKKPLARKQLFGEIFDHDVADLQDPTASLQFRWTIQGDWKLILPADGKNAELYF